MLAKLIAVNFAELQELIDRHLATLERVALDIDDWSITNRAELEASSQKLYEGLVRLENNLGDTVKNISVGRPN
ncbi:MAG: hypothetical protein Q8P36_02580 [bacterium]|nr:hypothetical protein [bacterium]